MKNYEINRSYEVSNTHEISVDWNGYNFLVIYGHHINGWFIAIPNWNLSVEASDPTSVGYNSEKLRERFRLIDNELERAGDAVANAIKDHWSHMKYIQTEANTE